LLAVALTVVLGSSARVTQSPDPVAHPSDQSDRVTQLMAGMVRRLGARGRLQVRVPKLGRPASVLHPVGHGVIASARER
jgi:hypothetical protein